MIRDRRLVVASLAGLAVVVAVTLGSSLRGPELAAASPSPAAAATAAVATIPAPSTSPVLPSPTASARPSILDDRFGFYLLADRSGKAVVRSETSAIDVTSFIPRGRSFSSASRVVSPDGRSLGYWDPIDDGAVLHVRGVTGGAARAVLTGRSELNGSTFTWSSDGTGLVAALDNNCFEFCSGRAVKELWTIDLTSGATEMIASGRFWLPVAWDRAAKVVIAGVSGPGGYLEGYDVISLTTRPYAVRSYGFPQPVCCALGLRASSDARYLLVAWVGSDIQWWPVSDPAGRATIPSATLRALWRPGTSEIWWVDGLTPTGCRSTPCQGTELVSFDVVSGARAVAARGTFGATLVGFRVDGSAAITEATGFPRELVFVEVASGRTEIVRSSGDFGEAVRLR